MMKNILNNIKAYQKRWLKFLAIPFLIFTTQATAQTTLEEYMVIAAENNPALKAAFADYQAALQQVPQVSTLPDPMFSLEYYLMPLRTQMGAQIMMLSLSQQFPWFGTLAARGDVRAQRALATYEMFQARKLNIFFDIKQWYYRLYLIDEQIRLTEENQRILSTFERVALSQFEVGRSGMVNVLKVQIESESLANDILSLQDQRSLIIERLNSLMNRPLNTPIATADTLTSNEILISREAIMDSIQLQNPELQALIYEEAAAEYQKRLAKLEGRPDFMVGVSYGVMQKLENVDMPENGKDMIMPMVSVSLPIYRKKYTAMQTEAEFMVDAAQQQQLNMQNELQLMLQEAWYDYLDAQRRINLFHRQTRLLQQTQDLQITTFTAAGTDFEEVLRLQRELYDYRLQLINALVDNKIAIAGIERLYGKELTR